MARTIKMKIDRVDELFSRSYWSRDKRAIHYAFGLGPMPEIPSGYSKISLSVLLDRWYYLEVIAEYHVLILDVFTNCGRIGEARTIAGDFLKQVANHAFDPILFCRGIALMKDYTLRVLHGDFDVRLKPLSSIIKQEDVWFIRPWFTLLKQIIVKQDQDVLEVCALRQLAEYLGRAKFESTFNQLSKSAEDKYVESERKFSEFEYSEDLARELFHEISEILPEDLWEIEMTDFVPSNSGGAPAGATREEGGNMWYKYSHMAADSRLFRGLPGEPKSLFPLPHRLTKLVRMCELCAVPKTANSIRWISKEPPVLSYLQHGVQRAMVRVLKSTVRKHLDFSDSARSGRMAVEGSLFGEYATIDLSEASDSITWKLVSMIFPRYVRTLLWSTRSDWVKLPSKRVIRMSKFAPMGSATCFPVESVVFLACVRVALRRYNSTHSIRKSKFLVYGDDLVVEAFLVPDLLKVLEECHFKVNNDKSFADQQLNNFREACGEEAYNGRSIKPLRVSRNRYSAVQENPGAAISSLIDRCNSTIEIFDELHDLFLRRCKQTLYEGKPLLHWLAWGDAGLSTVSLPFNRNRIWNIHLWRFKIRTLAITPLDEKMKPSHEYSKKWGLSQIDIDEIEFFDRLKNLSIVESEVDPWLAEKLNAYRLRIGSTITPILSFETTWGLC